MMRLKIKKSTVKVNISFWGEGSVLAETIRTQCEDVRVQLRIESDEPPEKIAKLARVAESGCYVFQSLRQPCDLNYQVSLNGEELEIKKHQAEYQE